jgi:hypothetical protein
MQRQISREKPEKPGKCAIIKAKNALHLHKQRRKTMVSKKKTPASKDNSSKAKKRKTEELKTEKPKAVKKRAEKADNDMETETLHIYTGCPHSDFTSILDIYEDPSAKMYWQHAVRGYRDRMDKMFEKEFRGRAYKLPRCNEFGKDYNGDSDSMATYDSAIPTVREKIISLGFSLRMSEGEINDLLTKGGYGFLYPRSADDAVYIYLLRKNNAYGRPLSEKSLFRSAKFYIEETNVSLSYYWMSMIQENKIENLETIRRLNEEDKEHTVTQVVSRELANVMRDTDWNRFLSENMDKMFMSPEYFCNNIIYGKAKRLSKKDRRKMISYINAAVCRVIDNWVNADNQALRNGTANLKKHLQRNYFAKTSTIAQWHSLWKKGTRIPGRPQLIQTGIGLGMDEAHINELLEAAHMKPLYAKDLGEGILIYILNVIRREYPDIFQIPLTEQNRDNAVIRATRAMRDEKNYFDLLMRELDADNKYDSSQLSNIIIGYIKSMKVNTEDSKLLSALCDVKSITGYDDEDEKDK